MFRVKVSGQFMARADISGRSGPTFYAIHEPQAENDNNVEDSEMNLAGLRTQQPFSGLVPLLKFHPQQ